MKRINLAEIRAKVAAATPGPWEQWVGHLTVCSGVTENTPRTVAGETVCDIDLFRQSSHDPDPEDGECGCEQEGCALCYPRLHADADLIAHAPSYITDLCNKVERLQRENRRLRALLRGRL